MKPFASSRVHHRLVPFAKLLWYIYCYLLLLKRICCLSIWFTCDQWLLCNIDIEVILKHQLGQASWNYVSVYRLQLVFPSQETLLCGFIFGDKRTFIVKWYVTLLNCTNIVLYHFQCIISVTEYNCLFLVRMRDWTVHTIFYS
jgi:hypothetical protein